MLVVNSKYSMVVPTYLGSQATEFLMTDLRQK